MSDLIRSLTRPRVPFVVTLGLFCAASIAVLLILDLHARYRDDIADAKRLLQNYSDILAEHTSSTFRAIDDKLRAVEEIRGLNNHGLHTPAEAASDLKKLSVGSKISVVFAWTDAFGKVLVHSSYGDAPLNILRHGAFRRSA